MPLFSTFGGVSNKNFGLGKRAVAAGGTKTKPTAVDLLLVAGGGGGQGGSIYSYNGAGGGGGGYICCGSQPITPGTAYCMIVGAGGAGSPGVGPGGAPPGGAAGSPTCAFGLPCACGGGGGGCVGGSGGPGGSGGGGSGNGYGGGSGVPGQGFPGATGNPGGGGAAGGGAGSAAGSANTPPNCGSGCGCFFTKFVPAGYGSPVGWFAGGGNDGPGQCGGGGLWGQIPCSGSNGVANSGGGAGGGHSQFPPGVGGHGAGSGGSGVILMRYPDCFCDPVTVTAGGSFCCSGGNIYVRFTSSGCITF